VILYLYFIKTIKTQIIEVIASVSKSNYVSRKNILFFVLSVTLILSTLAGIPVSQNARGITTNRPTDGLPSDFLPLLNSKTITAPQHIVTKFTTDNNEIMDAADGSFSGSREFQINFKGYYQGPETTSKVTMSGPLELYPNSDSAYHPTGNWQVDCDEVKFDLTGKIIEEFHHHGATIMPFPAEPTGPSAIPNWIGVNRQGDLSIRGGFQVPGSATCAVSSAFLESEYFPGSGASDTDIVSSDSVDIPPLDNPGQDLVVVKNHLSWDIVLKPKPFGPPPPPADCDALKKKVADFNKRDRANEHSLKLEQALLQRDKARLKVLEDLITGDIHPLRPIEKIKKEIAELQKEIHEVESIISDLEIKQEQLQQEGKVLDEEIKDSGCKIAPRF